MSEQHKNILLHLNTRALAKSLDKGINYKQKASKNYGSRLLSHSYRDKTFTVLKTNGTHMLDYWEDKLQMDFEERARNEWALGWVFGGIIINPYKTLSITWARLGRLVFPILEGLSCCHTYSF